MKTIPIFICFILLVNLWLPGQNQAIEMLLPQNGSAGEWLPIGETEKYASEELFYLINGGADLYLEYGFRQVVARTYENNQGLKINLEIYEMDNDSAAFGLFSSQKSNNSNYSDLGDLSMKTPYSLMVWKWKYLILQRSSYNDTIVQNGFCLLADAIISKIPENGNIPSMVSQNKKSPTEVVYFKGPIALNSIYYFSNDTLFATYEGLSYVNGSVLTLIFKYLDEPQCQAVYHSLCCFLENHPKYVILKMTGTELLVKNSREQELHMTLQGGFLKITIL